MDKISLKDIKALEHERDELVKVLDSQMLDPVSEEYAKIRASIDWCQRKIEKYHELQNEQEKIGLEYHKCDSSEKVAKIQLIGSITTAVVTTVGALAGNFFKYRMGASAIQDTTRQAFGLDQDKVQSRVASDAGKKMFDFFYR